MTINNIVTEVLARCGEGFQLYTDRAKSHIEMAINVLARDVPSEEIPELLASDKGNFNGTSHSITYSNDKYNKILRITVNDNLATNLSEQELSIINRFVKYMKESAWYAGTGIINIINAPNQLANEFAIYYIKPFSKATATELKFGSSFIDKVIVVSAETLLREINI